jgi:hypothetical protein
VVPHGFPFKFGFKVINLTEETEGYITSHKGAVAFGYDLLKSGIFFSNNGESVVRVKPQVSGFGARVISNNEYFLKLPFSNKLFKTLQKNSDPFELVNFVKNIEIKAQNVKAYDLLDSALIFDHEATYINLTWDRSYYYTNLESLINNIPSKYNLIAHTKIKDIATQKNVIAPPSYVYFILPNNKFDAEIKAELTTKAKQARLIDIVPNSSINVEKFIFNSEAINSDFRGTIALEKQDSRENGNFDFTLSLKLNKLGLLQLYSELQKKYFLQYNKPDIINENKELFDLLQNQYSLEFSTNSSYTFTKKLKNFNIENLSLMVNDDIGFNLKGQNSFSSLQDWYFEGNVLVFNFEAIVNNTFSLLAKYGKFEPGIMNGLRESIKLLLRGISEHPSSNSQDLLIDLHLNHSINNSKIGNVPLTVFLENYKKIFNAQNNK